MAADRYEALKKALDGYPQREDANGVASRLEWMRDVRDWRAEVAEQASPAILRVLLNDLDAASAALVHAPGWEESGLTLAEAERSLDDLKKGLNAGIALAARFQRERDDLEAERDALAAQVRRQSTLADDIRSIGAEPSEAAKQGINVMAAWPFAEDGN